MTTTMVIVVDVDALRILGGRLQTAREVLGDDAGVFGEGDNGIEHPKLRGTVDGFDERWSDKRHAISDSLDKVAKALATVADSFADTDAELATCILGTAGSGR